MDRTNITGSSKDLHQELISIFKGFEVYINNQSNKLRNSNNALTGPDVEEMNKLKRQRLEVRTLADKLEKDPNDPNISKDKIHEVIRRSRELLETIL